MTKIKIIKYGMSDIEDMTLEEIVKQLPGGHKAREEWVKLVKDSWFLECLEGAGVDNWNGYDDALFMCHDLGEPL